MWKEGMQYLDLISFVAPILKDVNMLAVLAFNLEERMCARWCTVLKRAPAKVPQQKNHAWYFSYYSL
jgi:hypothetical protein